MRALRSIHLLRDLNALTQQRGIIGRRTAYLVTAISVGHRYFHDSSSVTEQTPMYKVFASLLNQQDLVVNHDRAGYMRPTRDVPVAAAAGCEVRDRPEWETTANIHLDMNPWDWLGDGSAQAAALSALTYVDNPEHFIVENNQPCRAAGVQLQGVLNLIDNAADDGGFACVPGFWRHFDRHFAGSKRDSAPSLNFKPSDPVFAAAQRVTARAGALIVWDQRMPHGSLPNHSSRPRAAQFIKLFPRSAIECGSARERGRRAAVTAQVARVADFEMTPLARRLLMLD